MTAHGTTGLPRKWRTLAAVGFGTFMSTMDFSIVNVALPAFSREFDRSPDTVVWVALGSALVVTGLTLTAGRVGDLYGRKRVYLAGWLFLTVGLTGASFTQSLEQVIALRLVQAVGVSLAVANANAIVTAAFPDHERGRALGTIGAVVGAGLMSGPIVGGLILEFADWRAVFYTRIPIGLLALMMGLLWIEEPRREVSADRRLDIPGALLLFVALSGMLIAINRGQTWGWTSPAILGLATLGVGSLVAFVWQERRSPSPIVSLTLLRIRRFATSLVSLTMTFIGQSAVIFLIPFYLIEVRGFSTAETGLMLSTVPVMLLVFSPLSGWIADRTHSAHQATVGVLLVSLGLFSLATVTAETSVAMIVARLALVGVGGVVFGPPNTSTVMGSVPRSMLGTASASVVTARNVGNVLGLAVSSAVLVIVAGGGTEGASTPPPDELLAGVRAAFVVAGILSLVAIGASIIRGDEAETVAELEEGAPYAAEGRPEAREPRG